MPIKLFQRSLETDCLRNTLCQWHRCMNLNTSQSTDKQTHRQFLCPPAFEPFHPFINFPLTHTFIVIRGCRSSVHFTHFDTVWAKRNLITDHAFFFLCVLSVEWTLSLPSFRGKLKPSGCNWEKVPSVCIHHHVLCCQNCFPYSPEFPIFSKCQSYVTYSCNLRPQSLYKAFYMGYTCHICISDSFILG